jgi:predicted DNA-binding transcriptional regulator YafY
MDRTERFYRIEQLLTERGVASFADIQAVLEVSRATVKRDLEYLRNRMHAPIVFDRGAGGFRFDGDTRFELPGLWFSAAEIHALLTMQHLLAGLDGGGLLGPHIAPLMARLDALLGTRASTGNEVRRRVRILGMAQRALKLEHFERVGSALLSRKRLRLTYLARGTGEVSTREVSPQRLVHYRDNWYLDAWCHLRRGLRSFAVDAIRAAAVLETPARPVADKTLDEVLGSGYGIFAGKHVRWATLRFSPERARWVAQENWHPRQKSRHLADGRFELRLPYADDRELIMDILRHGADVEVVAPSALRERVIAALDAARARYRDGNA